MKYSTNMTIASLFGALFFLLTIAPSTAQEDKLIQPFGSNEIADNGPESGRFFIEPSFDDARNFSEGWGAVKKGDLWGYVNKATPDNPENMIAIQFEEALSFSEGLAAVKLKGLWGYIGKEVQNNSNHPIFAIEPQFDSALRFSYGLAPVEVMGRWGYIRKDGSFAIEPDFEMALPFVAGGEKRIVAAVKSSGKWGFAYTNKDTVISKSSINLICMDGTDIFDEVVSIVYSDKFENNDTNLFYIGVRIGMKYALSFLSIALNHYGKNEIGPLKMLFDDIKGFSEGFVAVKLAGKGWTYLDQNHHMSNNNDYFNPLTEPALEDARSFSNGYAMVKSQGKYGYLSSIGEDKLALAIGYQFEGGDDFRDGLAPVKLAGKWGYIDKSFDQTGSFVVQPKFQRAWPFYEGVAKVFYGGKYGYISRNHVMSQGRDVLPPEIIDR